MTSSACPCGSGRNFDACCEPIINGAVAPSAEALMRSRYSAYTHGEWAYLRNSWHHKTRPSRVSPANTEWLGLSIINSSLDQVEFIAGFRENGKIMTLHETSRFAKEGDHWRYLDGVCDVHEAGRNDLCPCGSKQKSKRCCGRLHKI